MEIWAACFADVAEATADWLSGLDQHERTILARLVHPRDAIGYAGRHAMLRAVLGRKVGLSPQQLRFRLGPFGKPELATRESEQPSFSISRSGELAVVAVADSGAMGVDIEALGPFDAGVARLFTADEQAALARLEPQDRAVAFYHYWVGKEAVLKAAGLGFSVPPDAVQITLPDDLRTPGCKGTLRAPRKSGSFSDREPGSSPLPCGEEVVPSPSVRSDTVMSHEEGRFETVGPVYPAKASDAPILAMLAVDPPQTYAVHLFDLLPGVIGATATERPVAFHLRWWRRCQWRAACSACTVSLIA